MNALAHLKDILGTSGIIGLFVGALGLTMMTRGFIYTFWPDGKMALKRQKKNLRVGFTTDMKIFGRKVRRLGWILAIVGGSLIGWHLSHAADVTATTTTSP